jgi:hypothetical protein
MNKNIIRLAIILVVAILVYSVFWFFKIGQVEKKISGFVNDNSSNVSMQSISVSGFPFSQKITIKGLKFSIPNSPLSKYQILVKNIEAETGIFSSDFNATIAMDAVALQDSSEKIFNIEFTQEPKINFLLSDEGFAKITYQDEGHKALDPEKNVIYSSASSMITFSSSADEKDKITHKIDVNVKDITGFDIVDLYRNSLEKKIVDGLKTGEISISNPSPAPTVGAADLALNNQAASNIAANNANPTQTTNITATTAANPDAASSTPKAAASSNPDLAAAANITNNLKPEDKAKIADSLSQISGAAPVAINSASTAAIPSGGANNDSAAAQTSAAIKIDEAISPAKQAEITKSNLVMSLEFFAASNDAPTTEAPLDPTKIQEAVSITSQGKTIKINNLEFSNDLYKLYVNGELNSFQDDTALSGSISIKVEKIANLTSSLLAGFNNILTTQKLVPTVVIPDLSADNSGSDAGIKKEDSYQLFLTKILANLDSVSKELAAKNPVTKEDVAVFDIRREKNLEFLINETSIREILGKF